MADLQYLQGKELQELRDIATELAIEYPKNISKVKLIDKIVADDLAVEGNPTVEVEGIKRKKKETVTEMKKRMNKLKRVRISSNDPMYKGRNGVSKQVGNAQVMVGKHIPFDIVWHIQEPVFNSLKKQTYRTTKFKTDKVTGNKIPYTTRNKSFVIEVLEQMTAKELKALAADQSARGSIPNGE